MCVLFERMSFNRGIGSVKYMEKRIPKNPRYQYVKTKLDTGCSLTNYLDDIRRNYKYRKDEIFKRLGVSTFAQMILQVASVSELNEIEDDIDSHRPEDCLSLASDVDSACHSDRSSAEHTGEMCHSARSTLLSVISGMGELSREEKISEPKLPDSPKQTDGPYPDCPYLLLDVRDRDHYDRCHIISAHSFPVTMLSRTMDSYTKEVREYRNAAGRIVILYDDDERIASQAATSMCQRGFDNLFILSGGLKVLYKKFPEGMTTGPVPTSCLASPTSSRARKSSVPQQQQQIQAAEEKWRFTSDELSKIQEELEEMLIPSRLSSRMSTISTQSRASSAGSRLSSSTAGRVQSSRPWK
ncbi:centrosomal protein of 41 kDa [Solea solea]|uniref:centrosomal protein of 41 kDa n=1 Tax=Solea solea TaxID=90069 RepID=UPI00272CD5B5|nr:centrosomal protein of 41 kDa [Solea solea]